MRETELYRPLAAFLTEAGYTVRAEVRGADIAAVKGDELVIVEMKTSFNLELLLQAAERLSLTPSVYVAVPLPTESIRRKKWRRIMKLVKRLELGMFFVSTATGRVQALFDPKPLSRRMDHVRGNKSRAEIAARSADHNTGGSTRVKLVTAYREEALRMAVFLARRRGASPKEIRGHCAAPKAASILCANYYGWFTRTGRGVYRLSPAGKKALIEYKDIVSAMSKEAS